MATKEPEDPVTMSVNYKNIWNKGNKRNVKRETYILKKNLDIYQIVGMYESYLDLEPHKLIIKATKAQQCLVSKF